MRDIMPMNGIQNNLFPLERKGKYSRLLHRAINTNNAFEFECWTVDIPIYRTIICPKI